MPNMNITVVDQVSSALSLASLRNQVLASNIANRDTQGYQRLKAQFADAWDRAGQSGSISQGTGLGGSPAVRGAITVADAGPIPSLEEEMVALSTNAMNYQVLARALSRYFSIAETIANGKA